MRWLVAILAVIVAGQQIAMWRGEQRSSVVIANLRQTVDQQGEEIAELKIGLHYQIRIAALIEKGDMKK